MDNETYDEALKHKPETIRREVELPSGSSILFFVNKETGLVVLDIVDKNLTGGNEIFRSFINEKELLGHLDNTEELPERTPEDLIVLTASHRLEAYHLKWGLKFPIECGCGDDPEHPLRASCKTHGAKPQKTTYFLESICSYIVEDDYEKGELHSTGCGVPFTPISKRFSSKEMMLKFLEDMYGYQNFEEDKDGAWTGNMATSQQVADHSAHQNGGWFKPSPAEIELWKEGKMKLYSEHIDIHYHTFKEE